MDRDDFIIVVYCLVCEHYKALCATLPHRLRRGGFAPELTDEEVITIEVCGEYFKMNSDKDIFAYFHTHSTQRVPRHFFPRLKERTSFVRQAANLWQFKARLQHRLTQVCGAAHDPVQVIDTLPLPVCTFTRSGRDRCFPGVADYGHCAAKNLTYYGFKLGLRTARCGMITHYPLLAARPHDVRHLQTLVEELHGLVPADKAFIDPFGQTLLSVRYGVQVVTPQRRNMKVASPHSKELLQTCARWRKQIETVGSHLTERFAVARIRVHDLWHFQHRLIRKVLAHTVVVFLNLQRKRPPLDLDGLVVL